jgi:hypothetical protein
MEKIRGLKTEKRQDNGKGMKMTGGDIHQIRLPGHTCCLEAVKARRYNRYNTPEITWTAS